MGKQTKPTALLQGKKLKPIQLKFKSGISNPQFPKFSHTEFQHSVVEQIGGFENSKDKLNQVSTNFLRTIDLYTVIPHCTSELENNNTLSYN